MQTYEFTAMMWPIVISAVFSLAWLIRLESKVLNLKEDHKEFKEQALQKLKDIESKHDILFNGLNEIKICLARIEGKISFEQKKKE